MVNRRARVFPAARLGGALVALVEPHEMNSSAPVHAQGFETVADDVAVVVDSYRRGKRAPAVARYGEAHVSAEGLFQRLDPGNINAAVGGHGDLRAIFAIGGNGFRIGIDRNRDAEAPATIVRTAHPDMPVLHRRQPQASPRIENGRGGERWSGEHAPPHFFPVCRFCLAGQGGVFRMGRIRRRRRCAKEQTASGQPGRD